MYTGTRDRASHGKQRIWEKQLIITNPFNLPDTFALVSFFPQPLHGSAGIIIIKEKKKKPNKVINKKGDKERSTRGA